MPDKFVSPCPPPTPYQAELASVIAEECCEVGQRAMKLLRFGVDEVQPGQPLNNAERMSEEIGDLIETVEWAIAAGIVAPGYVQLGRERKRRKLAKYLQHQPATAG